VRAILPPEDVTTFESLTAEREQVRKIHNMNFRHLGILLLQKNTKNIQYEFSRSWYSSVTEEYQDGENPYCEFFGLVTFLESAIHLFYQHTLCQASFVSVT
jgi:hypothetical protein